MDIKCIIFNVTCALLLNMLIILVGDITDMDNYRPITLTTVTSKLLEILILERFSSQLNCSSNNQHGFKAHHSTDTCVFIFKQIVQYYKDLYMCVFWMPPRLLTVSTIINCFKSC